MVNRRTTDLRFRLVGPREKATKGNGEVIISKGRRITSVQAILIRRIYFHLSIVLNDVTPALKFQACLWYPGPTFEFPVRIYC